MEERHGGNERPERAGWAGPNESLPFAFAMPALSAEVV